MNSAFSVPSSHFSFFKQQIAISFFDSFEPLNLLPYLGPQGHCNYLKIYFFLLFLIAKFLLYEVNHQQFEAISSIFSSFLTDSLVMCEC